MWQGEQWWSNLKPGEAWWMVVSGVMGLVGVLICSCSLTLLVGSMVGEGKWGGLPTESKPQVEQVTQLSEITEDDGTSENQVTQLVVDVSGGVNNPGLYQVPVGSRVGEVLQLAGGIASGAATQKIAQETNLAAVVQDGQKIFIPLQNTEDLLAQTLVELNNSGQSEQSTSQLVSINTASLSQLDELPGIGEKRAEAIIDGRPYLSLEELVSEGAITANVLAEIRSLISL